MQRNKKQTIIFIVLLVLCILVVKSHRLVYGTWMPKNDLSIENDIGRWKGKDQKVQDLTYQILEADSVIIKNYYSKDDEIWFALVYYKDNQIGFHTPEACFGGIGNTVFQQEDVNIEIAKTGNTLKVNQLKYKSKDGEKILYYFYITGDYFTNSYIKLRIKLILEQLKLRKPGVALIELYSPIEKKDDHQARENLNDFLQSFVPKLKLENR